MGPTQKRERRRNASKLIEIGVEICGVNVSRLTVTKVDCVSKKKNQKESKYGLAEGTKSLSC